MTLGHPGVNTLFCFRVPNGPSHQDACMETAVIKTARVPVAPADKRV